MRDCSAVRAASFIGPGLYRLRALPSPLPRSRWGSGVSRHFPSPLAAEGAGERAQGLPGGGTSWLLKAMIVYQSTQSGFIRDTFDHAIEAIISDAWLKRTGRYAPHAEVQAWQNSLESMAMVLDHPDIEDDVGIGVEFGIPQTAKRMDFLLTGRDESGRDRLV